MIASRAQFAEIIGVTGRQVGKWLQEGMPALDPGGKGRVRQIDTAKAIAWLLKRASGNTQLGPLADARAALTRAKAELATIQAGLAKGAVLKTEDVQIVMNKAAVTYVRAIEALPGRLAGALPGKDAAQIKQHVAGEVHAIRVSISEKFRSLAALGKQPAKSRKPATKPRRRSRRDNHT